MRIIIDAPVLAAALPSESPDHWLIDELIEEQFDLCVTEDILAEYATTLSSTYSDSISKHFLLALKILPNVFHVQVHYRWNLLPDQSHWVDTYLASDATYLVTRNPVIMPLKPLPFPALNILSPAELEDLLHGWT